MKANRRLNEKSNENVNGENQSHDLQQTQTFRRVLLLDLFGGGFGRHSSLTAEQPVDLAGARQNFRLALLYLEGTCERPLRSSCALRLLFPHQSPRASTPRRKEHLRSRQHRFEHPGKLAAILGGLPQGLGRLRSSRQEKICSKLACEFGTHLEPT